MRNRPQQTVEPHRREKTTAELKVFRSVAFVNAGGILQRL
jgi:hypothetical protein